LNLLIAQARSDRMALKNASQQNCLRSRSHATLLRQCRTDGNQNMRHCRIRFNPSLVALSFVAIGSAELRKLASMQIEKVVAGAGDNCAPPR
jgi:hypothetical protein